MEEIYSAISEQVFGVWFLIGAALVFWMQAGFAMVEAGFTRAKNSGNIIMKNLMDFCIGTVMFCVIGFSLLLGEDVIGFIGAPGFDLFTGYGSFDWSNFIFNLVFCATTATIVSGAMAERTKFLSYCVYSAVISGLIYPIEAHWIWGGGWLAQMGFHDFAGSCAIHMVGGVAAFVGAALLGPRIGKYVTDKDGKVKKVNAILGHNIPIGALGVFILWLGWYGFNGAACTSVDQLGSVFVTTTIAPALATVVCMIFTWIKYGKPDVSMTLNASLAGLVAITAPCDVTNAAGAIVIGIVAGLLVPFMVWFMDYKLHIDDPVGACAVHLINGIWGTLAVGLFADPSVPGYGLADADGNLLAGLFYGGGFKLLGIQFTGFISVAAWAGITMLIVFTIIKAVFGLRASRDEEIRGLDITEHGLPTAYAGIQMAPQQIVEGYDAETMGVSGVTPMAEAVEVKELPRAAAAVPAPVKASKESGEVRFTKVEIICKEERMNILKNSMQAIGITGMTVTHVLGFGQQNGKPEYYRGAQIESTLLPKVQVDIVVSKIPVEHVVESAKKALYTGHIGDGKIFIYDVENVIKVRTGEEGYAALQDEDEV